MCQMHRDKHTRKANGVYNKLLQNTNIPCTRAPNCSRYSNYNIYRYNGTVNVTINYGTKVPLSYRHLASVVCRKLNLPRLCSPYDRRLESFNELTARKSIPIVVLGHVKRVASILRL